MKAAPTEKCAVLLLNLGGPETLEDVRPFLYRLFSDPEIIRIKNPVFRRLLAWGISHAREKKSQNLYRLIGGGSPLRVITKSQAAALEAALADEGSRVHVHVGMLCGKPSIDEAFDGIIADGTRRLVLLPLFPQYSRTTTGACFRYVRTLIKRRNLAGKIELFFVENWYKNQLYIDAITDTIMAGIERFHKNESKRAHILYSAHALPERYIGEGDPYLDQTRECVSLINDRLKAQHRHDIEHSLAFQSRIGPVKWLTPSPETAMRSLAQKGVNRILAVPVSFVSDHIETLYELDIAHRKLASELGFVEFHRTESLNISPKFISALASIVLNSGRL